jgi:hypothetical protein
MNPSPESARHQLEAAIRQKDGARRNRTLFATLAAVVAVLLALAVLDFTVSLPPAARWVGLALWLAALVAGTVRITRMRRESTRLEEAARDVEATRPEFGCEISTAAEYLSGARKPTKEYEPEIAAALQSRAAVNLSTTSVPYARRLVLPIGLAFAGTLAAMLGFALFAPGGATSLLRAAAPWSKASLTRIQPGLGNGEFAIGTEFSLTNRFAGRIPAKAEFQFLPAGSNVWQSAPLPVLPDHTAPHSFRVTQSLRWRIAAGDAISPEFTLTAFTPPEVRDLAIRLTPPAYTRLPATEQKGPAITTLRGTRAVHPGRVRRVTSMPCQRDLAFGLGGGEGALQAPVSRAGCECAAPRHACSGCRCRGAYRRLVATGRASRPERRAGAPCCTPLRLNPPEERSGLPETAPGSDRAAYGTQATQDPQDRPSQARDVRPGA